MDISGEQKNPERYKSINVTNKNTTYLLIIRDN